MSEMNNIEESQKNKFIIKDIKSLISPKYYKFLFILIKEIFLKSNNKTTKSVDIPIRLDVWLDKINQSFFKDNEKSKLSKEYKLNNLINILKFAKMQNTLYAAEILENILIIIFSYAFKTKKENTFGKYIYNNIQKLKDKSNEDFSKWFIPGKFNQGRFDEFKTENDIQNILNNDFIPEENEKSIFQSSVILINFLLEIHKEKYCNKKYKAKTKTLSYINQQHINIFNNYKFELEDKSETCADKKDSKIPDSIYYYNYFEEIQKNFSIGITKAFFISVYIYYQNKYSPLMKYIKNDYTEKEKKELAIIPFEYDLTGAVIESQFAGVIMAPTRVEPRISKIIMVQNILKEKGFLELGKTLLFNKNLKIIDFHQSALKSNHLESLNNCMGLFVNDSVEELVISSNYIKDDCEEFLSKILIHLKGLKTINLSSNDFKNGISPFLIALKNLYRKKKINLENLILNKCMLDDIAFYELGELLESKYCKLKNLYLNMNNIPSNVNFLKKLKRNKSLTEIYLNKSNLCQDDMDNIMRIISNTNMEYLCLYKNKFNDFEECLKLLYRTKLVLKENEKKEDIIREDSSLFNIDLSNNDFYIINIEQLNLLKKILEESTLYCIDISHILFGVDPNRVLGLSDNVEKTPYQKSVINLKNNLDEKKKEYIHIIEEINTLDVGCQNIEQIKKVENLENFEKIEKEISEIIQDKNSKYPIFLRERAKKIIIENKDIFNKNNNLSYKEMKEKEINLAKYIELKKNLGNLMRLKEKKSKKKLIII